MQGSPDADEILERLAHFQALNTEVPRVKEVVHPLLAAAIMIVGLSLQSRAWNAKCEEHTQGQRLTEDVTYTTGPGRFNV